MQKLKKVLRFYWTVIEFQHYSKKSTKILLDGNRIAILLQYIIDI